jgi:putative transcriptional regulator
MLCLWKAYFTLSEGHGDLKNRLEELRKQRGIKQEELAEKLEVSRQTVGSLENGRYNPSIILAIKIARFFDMNVEEIFIYEEDSSLKPISHIPPDKRV